MKAGEITQARADALMDLKMEEVTAEVTKANREIADSYARGNSSRRSFRLAVHELRACGRSAESGQPPLARSHGGYMTVGVAFRTPDQGLL